MLSRKTQLCIEVLAAIGSAPQGVLLTTQALSERLAISTSHLEGILQRLKAGGFVHAVRGPGGGYAMARDPQQISVWDVVRHVGEPEALGARQQGRTPLTRGLEDALHQVLQAHLSSRSMGDFVQVDRSWDAASALLPTGFRLGPMPQRLLPLAPNSVFQLSAFMQGAPI